MTHGARRTGLPRLLGWAWLTCLALAGHGPALAAAPAVAAAVSAAPSAPAASAANATKPARRAAARAAPAASAARAEPPARRDALQAAAAPDAARPSPDPSPSPRRPAAEAELQALREALLERARDALTRVRSLAWIDADGRLHESSSFHSELDVRGVRLLAPAGPAEVPTADQAGSRPHAVASHNTSTGASLHASTRASAPRVRLLMDGDARPEPVCTTEPGRWQSPWGWQQRVQGAAALEATALHALARSVHTRLAQAARDDGPPLRDDAPASDTPGAVAMPATGTPLLTGAYARALMGRAVPAPPHQGRLGLHLALQPGAHALAPAQLRAELRLQRADGQPLWQAQAVWNWPELQLDAAGARVDAALQQAVADWATRQWPAVHARWRCEPPVWAAQALQGDRLEVLAGHASGLQPGDRLLLAPPALLPTRTLEPDALESLAVAEVLQVRGDRIEARLAAGPARLTAGPWRAWPY